MAKVAVPNIWLIRICSRPVNSHKCVEDIESIPHLHIKWYRLPILSFFQKQKLKHKTPLSHHWKAAFFSILWGTVGFWSILVDILNPSSMWKPCWIRCPLPSWMSFIGIWLRHVGRFIKFFVPQKPTKNRPFWAEIWYPSGGSWDTYWYNY